MWKLPERSSRSCYQFSLPATSFKTYGSVYSSCVQKSMLHASETWPLTKPNFQCLQRNDKAMIRQICNVKPQDIVTTRSNELLAQIGTEDWTSFWRRKGCASMVMWNAPTVQSRQPLTYRLMESLDLRRPKLTGKQLTDRRDCRVKVISYQPSWQTYLGIWCELCQAFSKPATWKGAHWCGCCPCTCTLIKNLMMMMMMMKKK